MPSDRVLANAIVDETGRAYGELPLRSRLVVTVSPGQHTFTKVLFKDPGNGNFSLWGHEVCNQLGGVFEAGKIYFVELSVWRPFTVHPDNPKLAEWAAAPSAELDPAKGPASVASDPEWANCVAQAQKNMAKDQSKNDQRSLVTAADGLSTWPR
jgi:hypothetical protein